MQFEFATSGRIRFGPGVISELPTAARIFGRRAFVVMGRDKTRHAPRIDALEGAGFTCSLFSVAGEPSAHLARRAKPATFAAPKSETSALASESGLAGILAELTQALRKFSVEQRRVPASLNELVAAGYIQNLPQPPPGKAFGIDPKDLQVILK